MTMKNNACKAISFAHSKPSMNVSDCYFNIIANIHCFLLSPNSEETECFKVLLPIVSQ